MTFPVTSVAPSITRVEIEQANEALKPVVRAIRLTHRQWMERAFMRLLKPAEYIVLSAIVSRTFGWSKALEIITLDQFTNGHRSSTDAKPPLFTHDMMPVWCGTGQDRKTIIKALSGLYDQGMITRFRFSAGGRDAMAYMPTTVSVFQAYLENRDVELAGELPAVFWTAKRQAPDGTDMTNPWEDALTQYAIGDPIHADNYE